MHVYFKKDKAAGLGFLLCVPASCGASVAFALAMQPVVDSILGGDAARFWRAALAFVFCGAMDACLLLAVAQLRLRLRKAVVVSLKEDLCGAMLRMPYQAYRQRGGDPLSVLNHDTATIRDNDVDARLSLYRAAWSFAFSMAACIGMSAPITAVVLAIGVASVLIPRRMGRRIDALQGRLSAMRETYSQTVQDMMGGMAVIKTTGAEAYFAQRHRNGNRQAEDQAFRVDSGLYAATWVSMLCSTAAYVAVLVLGGVLALRGSLTAGLVVSLSQLIGGVVAPLEQVPALLTRIRAAQSVCRKCEAILAAAPAAKPICGEGTALVCSGATFHYPGTQSGVENVSYRFEKGKKYLLVGPSGGGKSTLGRLLAGLYACEKGQICLPRPQAGRAGVLYVPQNAHIFRDTLRNNIALGGPFSDAEILAALDRCCLGDFLAGLPHGLDEVLQGAASCSGGEAARIGLARAVLRAPQVLVADEVTANLDPGTAARIDALLLGLQDTTLITISHKVTGTLVRQYHGILRLEGGRLTRPGIPGRLPAGTHT